MTEPLTEQPRVLIVDDRIADLTWLLDLIRSRGYEVVFATNEKVAKKRLEAVKCGRETYVLAVIDVMVATRDLLDLDAPLDEEFFENSRDTGIRLCEYARRNLGISPEVLPIVCLTAREDEQVKEAMDALKIPLFHRAPYSSAESIRGFIEKHLSDLAA